MEKKFKNKFVVEGPYSLLEAFGKELRKLGYQHWVHGCASKCILVNYDDVFKLENSYAFQDSYGSDAPIYNLPDQWHTAISAASETEEVVPEYVEVIGYNKTPGTAWYAHHVGKVFKVVGKYNDLGLRVETIKGYFIHHGYYKSSTREAFEAQQNAPKFKVGDFIHTPNDKDSFWLITEIEGDNYKLQNEIKGYNNDSLGIKAHGWQILLDDQAIDRLKKHYAKQGIVEGARVTWGTGRCSYEITQLDLVKRTSLLSPSDFSHGNSQLAIFTKTGGITPTTDGFKILPKEVKVAGYTTDIKVYGDPSQGEHKLMRIGCWSNGKYFTKDSLIAIKDLLSATGFEFIDFTYSPIGRIKLYKKEVEEAINLFN